MRPVGQLVRPLGSVAQCRDRTGGTTRNKHLIQILEAVNKSIIAFWTEVSYNDVRLEANESLVYVFAWNTKDGTAIRADVTECHQSEGVTDQHGRFIGWVG